MTIIWEEYRWVIYLALFAVLFMIVEEWAYMGWRKANPGAIYSHLEDKTLSILDPSNPPTTYYP